MKSKLFLAAACIFTLTSNAQHCLTAQYMFTGNANDNTGSNNGIANNAALCPDRFGNANSAYNFNGTTSSYIQLPTAGLLNNQYSYTLWVNLNSLPSSGSIAFILSIGSSNSTACQSLNIQNQYLGSTNTWGGGGYNTTTPNFGLAATSTVTIGQWYQLSTVRGSNYAKYFVNGVLVDSVGIAGSILPDYGSPTSAFIGKRSNNSAPVDAKIDDIGIYNCALSNAQIDSIYQAQSITGIEEPFNNAQIHIFPNPATGSVCITGLGTNTVLKLYTALGELIMTKEIDNKITLDTSALVPGVYLFSAEEKGITSISKLVVKR
jgi:hypothetical protein